MKHVFYLGLVGAALSSLAACSGSNDGNQNAEDTAFQPNSTQVEAVVNDPNNPFAETEKNMNEQMMAAVGTNSGDTWVRQMIAHHQGAINMSKIVLDQKPTDDVAMMARDAISKQTKEVGDLQKLVQQGTPNPKSAEIYRPVMTKMQQEMTAAKGANVSETYMRKMLAHHVGGRELADVALDKGNLAGSLRAQVEKTRDGQHKDAEMTKAMLSGASMQQAMKMADPKSSTEARVAAPPVDKSKPTPAKSKAAPVAEKPAEHDMSKMSDMEGM